MRAKRRFRLIWWCGFGLLAMASVARAGDMVWTTVLVDSEGGEFASLALDPSGNPHVTYRSAQGDRYLRYAAYDGTSWTTEAIELGGERTSLAIDSNGVEHISHSNSAEVLRYVTRTGGSWQGEDVGAGGSTSIALDAVGSPCIAHGSSDVGLLYSTHSATGWTTGDVDPNGDIDFSLAIRGGGNPSVVYRGIGGSLKYAAWGGTSWSIETLDSLINDPSLALDSSGFPRIAYVKGVSSQWTLMYAWWDGSQWETTPVGGVAGWDPSIALDDSDNPHIAYWGDGTLAYASFDGSAWTYETVALKDGPSQWGISLALDAGGDAHIAYGESGQLKYAHGVPEPATLGLLAAGLGAIRLKRRRR